MWGINFAARINFKNDQLYMTPINELKQLRQEKVVDEKQTSSSMQVNVSDPQHLELFLTAKTENWSGNEISFIFKMNRKIWLHYLGIRKIMK
ncbi:hypothetical protein SDC49_06870 [Lactobacillus sp. R2/2]|nr:hypothetical protein [Lactobacillus sp. R2/2]